MASLLVSALSSLAKFKYAHKKEVLYESRGFLKKKSAEDTSPKIKKRLRFKDFFFYCYAFF